jgi:hypothetical protein
MITSFLVKVVNHFLQPVFFFIVNRQMQFALFSTQHHALAFHAAHHVKRQPRLAPQRHFKKVFLYAFLNGFAKTGLYLKIPVCRA